MLEPFEVCKEIARQKLGDSAPEGAVLSLAMHLLARGYPLAVAPVPEEEDAVIIPFQKKNKKENKP